MMGGYMTIQFELQDLGLTQEEFNELCFIFECGHEGLESKIAPIFLAAAKEYSLMLLGEKAYTRGSDIRELRLFLLLKTILTSNVPLESLVGKFFQTTPSASRSLIRSVFAKYQIPLREEINQVLRDTVEHAFRIQQQPQRFLTINSSILVEELNKILIEIDGKLPAIVRAQGSVCTYEIKLSSLRTLQERFGLPIEPEER
jgi:hypothetical protein